MDVRGSVGDRPWGVVLAKLGLEGGSGQLTIRADGKTFHVAFARGLVTGATSPLTADSVARVALTRHLITSSQVPEIQRRITAEPHRDEIEIVQEIAKIAPEHVNRLRHRLIAQRAARTFALDRGDYVFDERITIPTSDCRLDIRNVVYLGVRMNLAEDRLGAELRQLGSRFVLKPGVITELSRFGFTDAERPILEELQAGATVPELEARHRDIDPRTLAAVVYSLAACQAVVTSFPQGSGEFETPSQAEVETVMLARGTREDLPPPALARGTREGIELLARPRPTSPPPVQSRSPITNPPPVQSRTTTTNPPPVQSRTLTGMPAQARTTSTTTKPPSNVMRGPATIRRDAMVQRPSAPQPASAPPPPAEPQAPKDAITEAAEAFDRGEQALRADLVDKAIVELKAACQLVPQNVFYLAMLRWAQFCGAADKNAVASETRKALELAVYKSDKSEVARFYLGRVERMLGHDAAALRHFREVLAWEPRHAEAASEVRIIEKRLAGRR